MKDTMTYKGYTESAHYDDRRPDFLRQARIHEISSVTRERMWIHCAPLEEAVDGYLDLCQREGEWNSRSYTQFRTCGWAANYIAVRQGWPLSQRELTKQLVAVGTPNSALEVRCGPTLDSSERGKLASSKSYAASVSRLRIH